MIQLSDHFTYKYLLRYTFPSILMLIFTSIYGVVDGFFISNFVGKTPFAAVNFIMPFLMMLGCAGFMFGAGGSALIAIRMGQGKAKEANELFSLIIYVSAGFGLVLTLLGFLFLRPVANLMGADGQLLDNCATYGRIILCALPFLILEYEFQCLFATAGKPKLGLAVTAIAGIVNMVLDALFVAVFRWGIEGAAAATAISQLFGGAIPLFYFGRRNNSLLRLVKCRFDGRALWKTCTNGSSELMTNLSMSLVNMLYNIQLMRYVGENGVSAYGVLMYVSLIFQAVFIGYAVGSAPVISYHHGAGNSPECKSLLKKSLVLTASFSLLMLLAGQTLARPLTVLFVGYDAELMGLTMRAFTIFSFSFLFAGFAIFGSSFFTALGDGLTSALISFLRTLLFQCSAVLLLPLIWGIDGIWGSTVAAEILATAVTFLFLLGKRKKFGYS